MASQQQQQASQQPVPLEGTRWLQRAVWRGDEMLAEADCLIEEQPLALSYNGISHAVMLATPRDLEDFALGFSLAEGIIETPEDFYDYQLQPQDEGLVLEMEIAQRCFQQLKGRRRTLMGPSGCGLCGQERLQHLHPTLPKVPSGLQISAAQISRLMAQLAAHQNLRQATGGCHAAAWVHPDGEPFIVREDVGRHNALDKALGAVLNAGLVLSQGLVFMTSRASLELVHKCARAGIGLLVARGAPTALAVETARQFGITLVGFARQQSFNLYSGPERILSSAPAG